MSRYNIPQEQNFVRVFNNATSDPKLGSAKVGSWMMKTSDIEGLSPREIQIKFALPEKPVFRVNVRVPAGTPMESSIAGKNSFGSGGGLQFRALQKLPVENYTNFEFLPEGPTLPMPSLVEPVLPFEEPIVPIEESIIDIP